MKIKTREEELNEMIAWYLGACAFSFIAGFALCAFFTMTKPDAELANPQHTHEIKLKMLEFKQTCIQSGLEPHECSEYLD